MLEPQLQSEFKLYLSFCSRKWLNSRRIYGSSLIFLRLQQFCFVWLGSNKFKNSPLENTKFFSEFRRLEPRLFHSMIVDGKKKFL